MRPWFEFDTMAQGPSQGISSVLVNPSAHAQSSPIEYVSCFALSPPVSQEAESYFRAHRRGCFGPGLLNILAISHLSSLLSSGVEWLALQEVPSRPICLQLLLCLFSQPGTFLLSATGLLCSIYV